MSSQSPASTQPSESGNYQLPALGSRPLMTTTQPRPPNHQTLPPPSALSGQHPGHSLPSHLDPPFVPLAPQTRPLYSDLSGRQQALHAQQPYSQGAAPAPDSWPVPAPPREALHGSIVSLPPLCPPDAAHQSRIPSTNYEPLSPAEHSSHGPPGRSSLFDDSTYSTRPYSTGFQPRHSPASSHHSSATSSSGQPSRAHYDPRPPAAHGEFSSTARGKAKEQNEFVLRATKIRSQLMR